VRWAFLACVLGVPASGEHCTTDRMIADIFTKALPHDAFKRFRDALLGAP